MKYVSLFSGIEAATVAWEPLGWKPVCFAEFDEFPSAVLAEPDSRERLDSCGNMFERFAMSGLSGFFGRTSRERSQAKVGRLSDSSCPKWTSSGTVWRGGYLMRSSSEWPSDAAVSFLSDILEPAPPHRRTH